MPSRLPANERLVSVAVAATEVFGRAGYRGTRTADVAARAGMSAGLLFSYVESKEALFHLVFLHGLGLLPEEPPALPLATPRPGESVALLRDAVAKVPVPRFRAALATREPADAAQELRGIAEEYYDLIARYWPLFAVIERCAPELPELDVLWFGETRIGFNTALGTYLKRRMARGLLRPMPDPMLAAKAVLELLVWFAWHRRQDHDAALYDDESSRRAAIEFVCAALVPACTTASASPAHAQNSAPKENETCTPPSGTIRPTSGYPTPNGTRRSPS